MTTTTRNHDTLLKLMRHPAVRAHIRPEVFHGLGHYGQIDHVISAVEEAAKMLPSDRSLQRDYQLIRDEYRLHLGRGCQSQGDQQNQKNPGYSSINGF